MRFLIPLFFVLSACGGGIERPVTFTEAVAPKLEAPRLELSPDVGEQMLIVPAPGNQLAITIDANATVGIWVSEILERHYDGSMKPPTGEFLMHRIESGANGPTALVLKAPSKPTVFFVHFTVTGPDGSAITLKRTYCVGD